MSRAQAHRSHSLSEKATWIVILLSLLQWMERSSFQVKLYILYYNIPKLTAKKNSEIVTGFFRIFYPSINGFQVLLSWKFQAGGLGPYIYGSCKIQKWRLWVPNGRWFYCQVLWGFFFKKMWLPMVSLMRDPATSGTMLTRWSPVTTKPFSETPTNSGRFSGLYFGT